MQNRTKMREMLSYKNPNPVFEPGHAFCAKNLEFLMGVGMLKATVAVCHVIANTLAGDVLNW
jgi:hypothetical protein